MVIVEVAEEVWTACPAAREESASPELLVLSLPMVDGAKFVAEEFSGMLMS
jgi:hypothetical protein